MTALHLAFAATLLAAWLPASWAQGKPGPHRDFYMYQGADRDQRILAGAKKEGRAVVYTSLNLKDSVPITQAFEKKYGVIGTESFRLREV